MEDLENENAKREQNNRKKMQEEKQKQVNDMVFKEWLRRKVEIQKETESKKRHETLEQMKKKRVKEDRDKRQKLDAKIAYKEWAEYK